MSILLSLQAVGSQAADQMPDLTAVTLPTEAEINVIDLAFKGGWIMVVLLLLSLMAIYIFVQRLIIIRRAGKEDETFMNRIKDYIHEGKGGLGSQFMQEHQHAFRPYDRERYYPFGPSDERCTRSDRECRKFGDR